MAHHGKKYRAGAKLIDRTKTYTVEEAVGMLQKLPKAKYDETVEVSIREGTTATRRRRRQRKAAKERAETAPAAKPTAKKPTKRARPAKATKVSKSARSRKSTG